MASTKPFKTADVKLTIKEFTFADALLRGLGNIEAAKEAGYKCNSDQSFAVTAQRVLNNVNVQKYIETETALKQLTRRKSIEVDDLWITEQFKEVYSRCMQRIPVMKFDREAKQMVQDTDEDGEGVWTFDSNGANRSLENLAKHIGYFELDNKQRAPVIQVRITQNNIQNNFIQGDSADANQLTQGGD